MLLAHLVIYKLDPGPGPELPFPPPDGAQRFDVLLVGVHISSILRVDYHVCALIDLFNLLAHRGSCDNKLL